MARRIVAMFGQRGIQHDDEKEIQGISQTSRCAQYNEGRDGGSRQIAAAACKR